MYPVQASLRAQAVVSDGPVADNLFHTRSQPHSIVWVALRPEGVMFTYSLEGE